MNNVFDFPNRFSETVRPKIRQCFFGAQESPSKILVTPIPTFFNAISDGEKLNAAWWPTSRSDDLYIVQVPQSAAVIDAMCCLEPGTRVIFAGLAGSLGALQIGDICQVETCLFLDKNLPRTLDIDVGIKKAILQHVGCLAESYSSQVNFEAQADCVDMESGYVYLAATQLNLLAASIIIISDCCPSTPFYEVDSSKWIASIPQLHSYLQKLKFA